MGATYSIVKTFSASKHADRENLGDAVTRWLADHPTLEPVETVVTQSSDSAFHCISITLFARERTDHNDNGGTP